MKNGHRGILKALAALAVTVPSVATAGATDAPAHAAADQCHTLHFAADDPASLRSAAASARAAGCELTQTTVDFDGQAELAVPTPGNWVSGHFDRVAPAQDLDVAVYRTREDHLVAMKDGAWMGSEADVTEAKAALSQTDSAEPDAGPAPSASAQKLLAQKRTEQAQLPGQLMMTGGSTSTTGKCSTDASYVLAPPYQKGDGSAGTWWIYWYYNPAGQPSNMSADNVKARVKDAPDNWEYNNNNCGITDWPNLTNVPMGSTSESPAQTGTACLSEPTKNIVGWKAFGVSDTLATTCDWSTGHFAIALNSSDTFRAAADISGCTGAKVDLESVLTHEWGHALGLNHVSAYHQVMNPYVSYCDDSNRYLGRGDWKGVKAIYGVF